MTFATIYPSQVCQILSLSYIQLKFQEKVFNILKLLILLLGIHFSVDHQLTATVPAYSNFKALLCLKQIDQEKIFLIQV